jgi:hypothetical protein
MKLVAQAQLMRDAKAAFAAAPFFTCLQPFTDKLPENKNENKKVLTVMITSNRGLCGPLNAGLIREVIRSPEFPKSSHVFIYGDKGATVRDNFDTFSFAALLVQQTWPLPQSKVAFFGKRQSILIFQAMSVSIIFVLASNPLLRHLTTSFSFLS